jgi:hypothetical protein
MLIQAQNQALLFLRYGTDLEVILQKLAFLFPTLSLEAFFPAKHNKKPPLKIAPREERVIKKVVYFSFFSLNIS